MAKKVQAGADFIQTQGIYDMKLFAKSMEAMRNMGLHEQTAMLAGITTDHRNGGPWVMWPDTPYAHIMIPVVNRTEM